MVYIDPNQQSSKENYRLLSSIVIPRPIAFVTSKNKDGVINAAPFSFFNVLTSRPPLISISIGRRNGKTVKDTAKNIMESKEFVVHIVDPSLVHEMNQTSAEYPSNVSEIEEVGLSLVDSQKVSVPSIKETKVRMECVLHQSIPIGNDEEYSCDLIIGKVVMFHLENELYQNGNGIEEKIAPLCRLGGANYAELGKIFKVPRPTL